MSKNWIIGACYIISNDTKINLGNIALCTYLNTCRGGKLPYSNSNDEHNEYFTYRKKNHFSTNRITDSINKKNPKNQKQKQKPKNKTKQTTKSIGHFAKQMNHL